MRCQDLPASPAAPLSVVFLPVLALSSAQLEPPPQAPCPGRGFVFGNKAVTAVTWLMVS